MFKHEFQGGPCVEVFSAQGRDPVAKWRLSGSASAKNKVYDKDVKSFVYILEGETTTTKMSLPKDEKQSLWLIQRFLILQLYVPLGHSFSLEFGITDSGNNKRRILLSSNHREVTVTHLHARFPLNILRLGVWLNLCMDLQSLVSETFKGQSFKALENLTISASCRLRKIFTMKLQPFDTTDDDEIYGCQSTNNDEIDNIPKALQLSTSPDVQYYTQVINMAKLWQAEIKAKEKAGLPPPSTPIVADSDTGIKQEEEPTHIAFGSKVVIPKHARKTSREGGASSAGARSSSGLNRSGSIPQLRTNSPAVEPDSGRESSRQTHRLSYQRSFSDATNLHSKESSSSQLEVEATQSMMQPRPPRTGSGGKARRRPFKVKHPGSGTSKSSSANDKDVTNNPVRSEVNGSSVSKDIVSKEKDTDSNQESISRSQSESSLKMSGNDSSLSESFNKLHIQIPNKEQNGIHNHEKSGSKEHLPTTTSDLGSPPVFTFSSRPRSAPRSPRSRRPKQQDSNTGVTLLQEKPGIQISLQRPADVKVSKLRSRKDSNRSEYDSDFYKASGESSAEEDDLQNFLKSSGNSRCSSQGSKLSPFPSPQPSPEPDPLSNSQILRMSVKSSLLKEIPSPHKNNTKSYDASDYQSDASSWRNFQSTASSWHFDTSVMSNSMLDKSLDKSFNSSFGQEHIIREETSESEEGIIINADGGDSLSGDSDDTSYSTWKQPPPPDKRVHRYLDEMRHPGPEPDLTATLPLDPREYTDVFSPPIVLPSQKISSAGQNSALSAALSPPRSRNPSNSVEHEMAANEEELDLLYDPCLNCYFDPKTHKYYELA